MTWQQIAAIIIVGILMMAYRLEEAGRLLQAIGVLISLLLLAAAVIVLVGLSRASTERVFE